MLFLPGKREAFRLFLLRGLPAALQSFLFYSRFTYNLHLKFAILKMALIAFLL
jgi:hypothetical protein